MSAELESAIKTLQKAAKADDEDAGLAALGTILSVGIGALERIAESLERLAYEKD